MQHHIEAATSIRYCMNIYIYIERERERARRQHYFKTVANMLRLLQHMYAIIWIAVYGALDVAFIYWYILSLSLSLSLYIYIYMNWGVSGCIVWMFCNKDVADAAIAWTTCCNYKAQPLVAITFELSNVTRNIPFIVNMLPTWRWHEHDFDDKM